MRQVVHGGSDKAVYVYPVEHYEYWRTQLPDVSFSWGAFGENRTTEGLSEDTLYIRDLLRAGSAILQVTQPRILPAEASATTTLLRNFDAVAES